MIERVDHVGEPAGLMQARIAVTQGATPRQRQQSGAGHD
jgi:hypothetical protein